MYMNQKRILKGYIYWFFGFTLSIISLIFIPIYANVLKNPLGDVPLYLSFILIFVGVFIMKNSSSYNIMLMSDFNLIISPRMIVKDGKLFIQGVPNNKYEEFSIGANQIFSKKDIIVKEIEKGIFVTTINEQELKFDMRGWIRKKYYIYEYFLTIIQLQNESSIYKKYHLDNITTMRMSFVDKLGKRTEKILIKNSYTRLSILFRHRTKTKFKINTLNNRKMVKNIRAYYDFN